MSCVAAVALSLSLAQVVPLKAGDPAPFSGQLLDMATSLKLVDMGRIAKGQAELSVKRALADGAIEKQRADALDDQVRQRSVDLVTCSKALGDCRNSLNRSNSILSSPWFWGPVGVCWGATVGLVLAGWLRR